MEKEQTIHTSPNHWRNENGLEGRDRAKLIRDLKQHREEYDVITDEEKGGYDGTLRIRCERCKEPGYVLFYKTVSEIPRVSQDCPVCGYKGLLNYLGKEKDATVEKQYKNAKKLVAGKNKMVKNRAKRLKKARK